MSYHTYCVKVSTTAPRIGEAVRVQLMKAQEEFPAHTVNFVAVVPRIIKARAFEHEVIEADVIVEVV